MINNPQKSIFRQNCEMTFGSYALKIPNGLEEVQEVEKA
jgi:hypothetical protein